MSSLTIDMFVPTSTYPDSWFTPGVVSHTPEFRTKRSAVSFRRLDLNSMCDVVESLGNPAVTSSEETAVPRTAGRTAARTPRSFMVTKRG